MTRQGGAAVAAVLVAAGALSLGGCASTVKRSPLATVSSLDPARYAGVWYEIARYPNRFQSECAGDVTATYARRDDSTLAVTNACRRADGTIDTASGVARIMDPATNAKLEVRFAPRALAWIPQVWGDYWVLALDPSYNYALVGEPSREYLWVLARTPELGAGDYERLKEVARGAGYDPGRLQRTPHAVTR